MSSYDEFDLDLKSASSDGGDDGVSPAAFTAAICVDLSIAATGSLLGGCTNGGICDYTESCPNTSPCTGSNSTCTCYC